MESASRGDFCQVLLPNHRNTVLTKHRIDRHQQRLLDLRLRHQHAIERVAVRPRPLSGRQRMRQADRQQFEALLAQVLS